MSARRSVVLEWLLMHGHITPEQADTGMVVFPDGSIWNPERPMPTVSCRHCGQVLLIQIPGEAAGPAEYAEKVLLHEGACPQQ